MATYDAGSNPVKSYPASSYKRMGLDVYPNPYFDPSSWYIPPTVKEMFRWCLFLYLTNSTIGPIIRKKASYVVTSLSYESTDPGMKAVYKHIFEKVLKIRRFEILLLLDHETYGNAYASILYPFDRFLVCGHCGYENLIRSIPWTYDQFKFTGKCKNCQANTHMEIKDKFIRNRSRIKLVRWNPMYIEPSKNPTSGRVRYILRIPKWLRQRINDPKLNKVYVEDTPKVYLDAMSQGNNIELDSENIFHMKYDSISMEDDSLGIPPILGVIKDAWLYQTYRKGEEAVALDHMLPLSLISPMPSPGGASPHLDTDLGSWRSKMTNIISSWRRDPNALFPVPFPVQVSQVRGDAQSLSMTQQLDHTRNQIAGGLDFPADIAFGGATWSGGNVSLRVVENLFIERVAGLNDDFLGEWLIPRIRAYFNLGPCIVKHKDFKMADDVQQKQIALSLRTTNTISDRTTLEELDFDYDKEQESRKKELEARFIEQEKMQIAAAETEAKIMIIRAKAQAQVNTIMAANAAQDVQSQAAGQATAPGPSPQELLESPPEAIVKPPGLNGNGFHESPLLLDLKATNFMKTTQPQDMDYRLAELGQQNPILAKLVSKKLDSVNRMTESLQPLPEQKPPRRGPGKAVI
jgi:hypothetical protein